MEALYNIEVNKDTKISVSKGNEKLGKKIYNINLLPGDEPLTVKTKGLLTTIKGTCGGVCSGCKHACYAVKGTKQHHNACIPAQGKNTLMMRKYQKRYFKQIKKFIKKHKVAFWRWHSSGEIPTYNYLLNMVEVAKEYPNTQFYFYTKRFSFIDKYIKEHQNFPDNLVCNISRWHNNDSKYDFSSLNKFIYDDGTEDLSAITHCPAVAKGGDRTGVTCDQCGRCYRKATGQLTAVYDH